MRESKLIPGTVWQHYKGGRYVIICLATDVSNLDNKVVYADYSDNNRVWVRSLDDFLAPIGNKTDCICYRFTEAGIV